MPLPYRQPAWALFCRFINFADSQTSQTHKPGLFVADTHQKQMSAAQPLVFGLLSQQTHMA